MPVHDAQEYFFEVGRLEVEFPDRDARLAKRGKHAFKLAVSLEAEDELSAVSKTWNMTVDRIQSVTDCSATILRLSQVSRA